MILLVEDFIHAPEIPDAEFQDVVQLSKLQGLHSHLSAGRPPLVIMHCMERMSKSRRYTKDEEKQLKDGCGTFHIESSGKTHTFGAATGMPSSFCQDWFNWHIPCKHFFAVFRLFGNWTWDNLPPAYLSSPFISGDYEGVQTGLDSLLGDNVPVTPCVIDTHTDQLQDEHDSGQFKAILPKRKVSVLKMFVLLTQVLLI